MAVVTENWQLEALRQCFASGGWQRQSCPRATAVMGAISSGAWTIVVTDAKTIDRVDEEHRRTCGYDCGPQVRPPSVVRNPVYFMNPECEPWSTTSHPCIVSTKVR
jgi:hypothetical protein